MSLRVVLCVLALATGALSGCSDDAPMDGGCTIDTHCPSGNYCGANNLCTFDCETEEDCPVGQCSDRGRCVPITQKPDGG